MCTSHVDVRIAERIVNGRAHASSRSQMNDRVVVVAEICAQRCQVSDIAIDQPPSRMIAMPLDVSFFG